MKLEMLNSAAGAATVAGIPLAAKRRMMKSGSWCVLQPGRWQRCGVDRAGLVERLAAVSVTVRTSWPRGVGNANVIRGQKTFTRNGAEDELRMVAGAAAVTHALAEVAWHVPVAAGQGGYRSEYPRDN